MKTNEEYEKKLERFIQDQLKQLPERDAPSTLIPRVLAAIENRQPLRWWQCSIFAWPSPLKLTCAAILVLLPAVSIWAASLLWGQIYSGVPVFGSWAQSIRDSIETLAPLGNALLLVVRSLEQPWVIGTGALVAMMYLACVGLGTVCIRVATHKR